MGHHAAVGEAQLLQSLLAPAKVAALIIRHPRKVCIEGLQQARQGLEEGGNMRAMSGAAGFGLGTLVSYIICQLAIFQNSLLRRQHTLQAYELHRRALTTIWQPLTRQGVSTAHPEPHEVA